MKLNRADGRRSNELRPLGCTRGILGWAHGSASWSQGGTKVVAAVQLYGPKGSGTNSKKNENPEKACFEVNWNPKTGAGQCGKAEREYEIMILERVVQSISCDSNHVTNPNTTTISVIIQVVDDDGGLLPCAINATCAALVDAGIPLKNLAVAVCCCSAQNGDALLDPTKFEEQTMKAFVSFVVFPNNNYNQNQSNNIINSKAAEDQDDIITCTAHGTMLVDDYFRCLERGRAGSAKLLDFLITNLQQQVICNQFMNIRLD